MTDYLNIEDDGPLRRVLHAAAFLLVTIPFVQALSQLWPLQLSNIEWRFSAANALSSVLLLPFLGLSLWLVVARLIESRGLSRFIGIVSALLAVALLASLVLFVLDALQLKTIVTSQRMQAFNNAFLRVGLVTTIFTVTFALLALAGLKGPKAAPTVTKKASKTVEEPGSGVLIVGRDFAKAE